MKILFMGTPDIAASCLQALLDAKYPICGVYTREDKPVGRKQVLTAPPVKQLAETHGLSVFQPKTLKNGEEAQRIAALSPDIIVVVAYGRILPQEILDLPQYGCINLHVSLLPKYRGAAPVQHAVLNGDTQTGVTIMQLDAGLDTGDILCVKPVMIGTEDTSGDVFEAVTETGIAALLETLQAIENGTAVRTPQNHVQASLAPPLTKEQAKFSFYQTAEILHNLVRGMNPWPLAYFETEGKRVKVTKSKLCQRQGVPGEILALKPLIVACREHAITLEEVVPEGSRPMDGSAWAMGKRFQVGDIIETQ